ncbi:hypothetical protein [Aestuariivita sp.]|jgi:hypothetical protein|uniref:hypothetical protein n=1 Tax=Aestuariivita sp. TaxID=1872407 RepID=UPI00216FED55|nr:hypothetical protein [Aestuariivita sp.]MCE8009193.1 hypothetical protein [Aestuariivita sp.]
MSFIRPEARALIWRLREVLTALTLGALGVWMILGRGLTVWLGYAAIAVAIALLVVGVQRTRFRRGGGGMGVVAVDEGQVVYFGPLTGGVVALREVSSLTLDPTAHPAHWILSQPGQPDLAVPVDAEGAEALFDAFTSLPGIRTQHMLSMLKTMPEGPVVIWRRDPGVISALARD